LNFTRFFCGKPCLRPHLFTCRLNRYKNSASALFTRNLASHKEHLTNNMPHGIINYEFFIITAI
jgi:hypothetical protein